VGDAENPVATECAATGAGRYGRKCFKMSGRRLAARMPLGNRKEGMQVMLRVSYSDTAEGQRWNLCGRLAGPWVGELRSCWQHARERTPLAPAVVDLKDVTFIDEAGERLLAEMEAAGIELVAAGVENRHLIATLRNGAARPLRRGLDHLCPPCGKSAPTDGGEK